MNRPNKEKELRFLKVNLINLSDLWKAHPFHSVCLYILVYNRTGNSREYYDKRRRFGKVT